MPVLATTVAHRKSGNSHVSTSISHVSLEQTARAKGTRVETFLDESGQGDVSVYLNDRLIHRYEITRDSQEGTAHAAAS